MPETEFTRIDRRRTTAPSLRDDLPAAVHGLRGLGTQHWSSPFAGKRVHLIGIGGCGMRGLAGVMLRCGARVSGSDRIESQLLIDLAEAGASVFNGQSPRHVPMDCDLVVYSAAIHDENPELLEARRRGVPCRSYSQMLGEVMRLRTGLAVSGTHGKSTTTAMVAFILRSARLDPTFVVGAEVPQLEGGCGVGDGPHFVAEACEYACSFLNLSPRYAVILNIEEDHLDYFQNLDAIIEAFSSFASLVPHGGVIVANAADRAVNIAVSQVQARVETFGLDGAATWSATDMVCRRGCWQFTITREDLPFVEVNLSRLPGRHQIGNALAAAALASHAGVAPEVIGEALSQFGGVLRRLTHRGKLDGIDVYDDYGHHPTEVQVTLKALRDHHPGGRIWVVFQPHQHSRTRFLLNDFARSFGAADHLIVPDIYFVRDSEAERDAVCSADLVERVQANGGDARYLPDFKAILEHLRHETQPGDVILTMGAGDIWKVADGLVRRSA
jgi:UDP-N-acetylmuramate--alanine ligase